jgi:hypothetical protein
MEQSLTFAYRLKRKLLSGPIISELTDFLLEEDATRDRKNSKRP